MFRSVRKFRLRPGNDEVWSLEHDEVAGPARRRLSVEIWIVLGLSLGRSGIYALLNIIDRLTAGPPLSQQTAVLNPTQNQRGWLDFLYNIVGIGFALIPVALALYLLSSRVRGASRRIGLITGRPGRDALHGLGLAALIGVPGLGVYLLGRAMGITVNIAASGLNNAYWWTVPMLCLSAIQNSLLEEIVAVAYLTERTRQLGWGWWPIIIASAVLRGSYHLYQGIGPFFGNIAMGIIFTWYYTRTRRVAPLVFAHAFIDIVAFIGYAYFPAEWLAALGIG